MSENKHNFHKAPPSQKVHQIERECKECQRVLELRKISRSTDEGDICVYCDPDLQPDHLEAPEGWTRIQAYIVTRVCDSLGGGPEIDAEWGDDGLRFRNIGTTLSGELIDAVNEEEIALRDLYVGDDGMMYVTLQYEGAATA